MINIVNLVSIIWVNIHNHSDIRTDLHTRGETQTVV